MSAFRIDLDFQDVGSSLHCPVCGTGIFLPQEDVGMCPHLLFAWIDVVGDFLDPQTRPEIRALARPEDEDEIYSPLEDEFLAKCPRHTVVFTLTESGFGCSGAPSSITVAAGFKFPD